MAFRRQIPVILRWTNDEGAEVQGEAVHVIGYAAEGARALVQNSRGAERTVNIEAITLVHPMLDEAA
jgi:hypothetical protein